MEDTFKKLSAQRKEVLQSLKVSLDKLNDFERSFKKARKKYPDVFWKGCVNIIYPKKQFTDQRIKPEIERLKNLCEIEVSETSILDSRARCHTFCIDVQEVYDPLFDNLKGLIDEAKIKTQELCPVDTWSKAAEGLNFPKEKSRRAPDYPALRDLASFLRGHDLSCTTAWDLVKKVNSTFDNPKPIIFIKTDSRKGPRQIALRDKWKEIWKNLP